MKDFDFRIGEFEFDFIGYGSWVVKRVNGFKFVVFSLEDFSMVG